MRISELQILFYSKNPAGIYECVEYTKSVEEKENDHKRYLNPALQIRNSESLHIF